MPYPSTCSKFLPSSQTNFSPFTHYSQGNLSQDKWWRSFLDDIVKRENKTAIHSILSDSVPSSPEAETVITAVCNTSSEQTQSDLSTVLNWSSVVTTD